jgi:hypothetical protein
MEWEDTFKMTPTSERASEAISKILFLFFIVLHYVNDLIHEFDNMPQQEGEHPDWNTLQYILSSYYKSPTL